jgi:hypothetical protein
MKHSSSQKSRQSLVWTAEPVTASPVFDAEFLDSSGVFRQFNLRRTYLYQLLKLGLIKGVSIRPRGSQQRGKRLWNVKSIREYLAAQMENGK